MRLAILALVLSACSANVVQQTDCGPPCAAHTYLEFVGGEFACNTDTAPACGFAADFSHAPIDESVALCACGSAGKYGCSAL